MVRGRVSVTCAIEDSDVVRGSELELAEVDVCTVKREQLKRVGTNGNGQMDGNFGVRAVTSNPMRGGRKAEDEAS